MVVRDRAHFEPFVIYRLDRDFGLDRANRTYQSALQCLGRDFHNWVDQSGPDAEAYGLTCANNEVLIRPSLILRG